MVNRFSPIYLDKKNPEHSIDPIQFAIFSDQEQFCQYL